MRQLLGSAAIRIRVSGLLENNGLIFLSIVLLSADFVLLFSKPVSKAAALKVVSSTWVARKSVGLVTAELISKECLLSQESRFHNASVRW